ncbi:putative HMP/thiamine import ATP-binding protein YkoD [Paenibacillus antibioticophila]|uniref:HMP/thiamine import ATP-binding protein YkoD n=1 Tax=Paenibacillus antibioticophila TaxID=1274374 RepID=A0A919XSZ8_9BACL|nr:ABC transporter ATP-binding protein [Paenibacillus antibioticophila]GIO37876.1 putative HMP/thiamine import ATP-binding protein YkoD [Paenibacillus antibioticophila]
MKTGAKDKLLKEELITVESESAAGGALRLEGVGYRYKPDSRPVLDEISFSLKPGEWVTIAGPSGCGKSTLARILAGDLPRAGGGLRTGEVMVNGIDPADAKIAETARTIGLVFQDPDAQLVMGRVEDEVAFGPENLCLPPEVIRRQVAAALEEAGLEERRRDSIAELSGGGRQRTAIASVLALETPILVLDEAASNLDAAGRRRLQELLQRLHRQGRTLLVVTGRLDELALAAPRLIVLDEDGHLVQDGPSDALLREERPLLRQLGLLPAEQRVRVTGGSPSMEPPAAPLLEISGLTFQYGRNTPAVLEDVSLKLQPGEWHLLTGDNGSGKTTLSRLLLGLLPLPAGSIFWQGRDIAGISLYKLAEEIGYVFQQPELQFVTANVMEELLYGPRCQLGLRAKDDLPEQVMQQAEEVLQLLGLQLEQDASPYLLSGGKKRLLSAASVFMTGKKLIILDEPTAGADYLGAGRLSALCRRAVQEGASILMITHEPEFFAGEYTIRWHLENGRLNRT